MSGAARKTILSVWNKKRESRVARAGRRGQGRGGCESRDVYLHFHSFSFSTVLCCWQQGWKEEKKERGAV